MEVSATEATFKGGLKKDGLKLKASKSNSFAFTYIPQGQELIFEFSGTTSALEIKKPALIRFKHSVNKKSSDLDVSVLKLN